MKIQWIDHDTGDHDSWCVNDMLPPAAIDKLLGGAGRLAPYHCWHTLHLDQRWFWLFKEFEMCLVD